MFSDQARGSIDDITCSSLEGHGSFAVACFFSDTLLNFFFFPL